MHTSPIVISTRESDKKKQKLHQSPRLELSRSPRHTSPAWAKPSRQASIIHGAPFKTLNPEANLEESQRRVVSAPMAASPSAPPPPAAAAGVGVWSPAPQSPSPNLANFFVWREFVWGAIAGAFGEGMMHPVDTLKTRLQSQAIITGAKAQKNIFQMIRTVWVSDGLKGFYRGISPGVTGSLATGATYFGVIESTKTWLEHSNPNLSGHWSHFIAGGIGDTLGSFIYVPCEVMKQRMQVQGTKKSWALTATKGNISQTPGAPMYNYYNGMFHAGCSIWRDHGLKGLYAGYWSTLARDVPFAGLMVTFYEAMKELTEYGKRKYLPESNLHASSSFEGLLLGGLAGGFSAYLTTPLDVIKTRLQVQGSTTSYNGWLDAITKTWANEGMSGLFKGSIPRIIWYIPASAFTFMAVEFLRDHFNEKIDTDARELTGLSMDTRSEKLHQSPRLELSRSPRRALHCTRKQSSEPWRRRARGGVRSRSAPPAWAAGLRGGGRLVGIMDSSRSRSAAATEAAEAEAAGWVTVEEWAGSSAAALSRTAVLTASPSSSLASRRFGSRWGRVGGRLLGAFVPEGFPGSVTPDYVPFQMWDTLQGLSTYIRAMLSTQALLGAIGVGEKSATVIGATFQWFLRDLTGMLGGILFTFYQGSNLDSNAKMWRLVADFMNDLAGVASGATRAALTQHFALANNAADISAKEGSQETLATMLGMGLGMLLAHVTRGHAFANYKAVQSLSLTTLNYERSSIMLQYFMDNGEENYFLLDKGGSVHIFIHKQAAATDILMSFIHGLVRANLGMRRLANGLMRNITLLSQSCKLKVTQQSDFFHTRSCGGHIGFMVPLKRSSSRRKQAKVAVSVQRDIIRAIRHTA
uniref:Protein root UVB sensitive/RUS domain-containing protein n=1 Tax=Oryza barthii TaxID=65489 RepID=A0A0D3FFE6_9ORYZ